MGWTGKKLLRARLRRRPQLEQLDDRCLLSSVAAIKPIEHHALLEVSRAQALVAHHQRAVAKLEERFAHKAAHHTPRLAKVERPAGSIETGAATAYDPIIEAALARSTYNVDGTGMTVAVIDTGVDYNNPALGGGFGPGNKVIAGYDFADDSSDPMAVYSQHGTSIAGLIGSSDPSDLGVAPGVNIVALRVTDSSNTASLQASPTHCSGSSTITASTTSPRSTCRSRTEATTPRTGSPTTAATGQQVTQLIGQLTAMNIPVIAATGNNFTGPGRGVRRHCCRNDQCYRDRPFG